MSNQNIYCVGYAGSNTTIYKNWTPNGINIIPLELRGRGKKVDLPYYNSLLEAAKELAEEIEQNQVEYNNCLFSILGHSAGVIIAFEIVRILEKSNKRLPQKLIVIGQDPVSFNAPDRKIGDLNDDEFVKKIALVGYIPSELIGFKRMYGVFISNIKKDISLIEAHNITGTISTEIMAVSGDMEKIFDMMERWKDLSTASFQNITYEGNHFALYQDNIVIEKLAYERIDMGINTFTFNDSNEYNTKIKNYLPFGCHSNFRFFGSHRNIHFKKGNKSRLIDLDGNEFLDLNGKYGSNILGHCNQQYSDALKNAIDTLLAADLSDIDYEVCEKICNCLISAEKVRFSLSGTEAIQNALRLARAYTSKNKFLRFEQNYHGNADNILGGIVNDYDYPVPFNSSKGNSTEGRAKDILESQSFMIPWNDIDMVKETVEKHRDEIAAIITEPISINGGGVLPKGGYLQELRKLCTEHNIVLIFDEVITGFRVSLGGAQRLYNVKPDLTILGKALGGGIPISAIVGKKEIMSLYDSLKVTHGGTFNGYRLGLIAANVTIDILSYNNEEAYKNMKLHCSDMYQIVLDTAEKYELKLKIQGPVECYVLSYNDPTMSGLKNKLMEAIITDEILVNGIYLSNENRFYGNVSLDDNDVELFGERLENAFRNAKFRIQKFNR